MCSVYINTCNYAESQINTRQCQRITIVSDIRLIFVRDGVSLDRKRLTRNSRKYERVGKTIYKVLDTLERKQLPTDVQWKSRGVVRKLMLK
jgi:hypothetical protein